MTSEMLVPLHDVGMGSVSVQVGKRRIMLMLIGAMKTSILNPST
jgi:hypothetical protein